jgi:hypothetical protein
MVDAAPTWYYIASMMKNPLLLVFAVYALFCAVATVADPWAVAVFVGLGVAGLIAGGYLVLANRRLTDRS